jgi:excisionase family DNA binding protein
MALTAVERGPVVASDHERGALKEIDRVLARGSAGEARLLGPDGNQVELPESVYRVLRQAIHALTEGQAVSVISIDKDLTTQQAADLLNVSRPYLVRLLDGGTIPSTKTGTHRRVRFDDVMSYKRRRDAERRAGLRRLTKLSQEFGLYS